MEPVEEFVEDFLEHHGVKGMKWGVRKSRSELRQLNKSSKQADKKKFDDKIDKARGRISSGSSKNRLKKAKVDYKANKYEIGSREARKILNKAKSKYYSDVETSQLAKTGKERVIAASIAGISLAAVVALQVAQNR